MSTVTKLMTADELFMMPSRDMRHELIRGELLTMAPAGFEHGSLAARVFRRLSNHAEAHGLGEVVSSDTGFYLTRNPDTVRAPDVAFVKKSRLPSPPSMKFFEGAPDIAVEVISPSDTLEDVEDKVDDYLNAGTHQVWVVNPRRKTITIHSVGTIRILRETDSLDGGTAFPGFVLRVGEIFG